MSVPRGCWQHGSGHRLARLGLAKAAAVDCVLVVLAVLESVSL